MEHSPSEPPVELDGARVERFASLVGLRPSGKVTVLMDGREIEPPSAVAICRYPGESSVYLFHCSAQWVVLAAAHDGSLETAQASAELGHDSLADRWVDRAAQESND